MTAVDTNVLLHAHRPQLPRHREALAWLRRFAEGSIPWGIPVFCLGEFVRVATHPRIFSPPSSLDEALGSLAGLLKSPSARILNPGRRFSGLLESAIREADARGNLAFDAQIAAVCYESGVRKLLTLDRDFRRFSGLEIVDIGATAL